MCDNNKKNDMLHGNLFKGMLLFALPLALTNLLQVLFNLSDLAIVGNFAGANAAIGLGAVGSTAILVTLFTGFVIGLGGAINVIVAKYLGAHDAENTKASLNAGLVASVIIGAILAVVGYFLTPVILELIETKEAFMAKAVLYLRVYLLGMPALAIYNYGNGVFSAIGDTKKPLYILTASGVLNIILNLFFVVIVKIDVLGVALASIISQYLSAVVIIIFLAMRHDEIKLSFKNFYLKKANFLEIIKLGIPAGVQNSIFAIANLFIQNAVNSFDDVIVEGNSVAMNYDSIFYDVMSAFYMAGASYIGQAFGAGDYKRIKKSFGIAIIYSFSFALVLGLLFFFFGSFFLLLFTQDETIIVAGLKRSRIMALSYCVSAFMDAPIAACRGLGKTIVPSIITIMGSCLFRILWIFTIFKYYHTIPSLYLLYVFSWTLTAIFELGYFFILYRRLIKKNDGLNAKTNLQIGL